MTTEPRRPRILITCAQMQEELPRHAGHLHDLGYELIAPPLQGQQFTSGELSSLSDGVVGMIAGDDELDEEFLANASSLRVLIRWGIGMDSVDHAAAKRHGITVRNTPGVFGGEVADSAVAYMLMLARRHHEIDASVRDGGWPKVEGLSLSGQTVGIVGLGDIGISLSRRAAGFGMSVIGYDPYAPSSVSDLIDRSTDLSYLLSNSRFVVLTCPLTDETRHLINATTLAHLREDAFVINVARGPVIDEAALTQALLDGKIAGAGLDVFEHEPLPADSRLRGIPNVILGAHNGSNTRQGVERASSRAVERLLAELRTSAL